MRNYFKLIEGNGVMNHEKLPEEVQVYENVNYEFDDYWEDHCRLQEIREEGGGGPIDEDGRWVGGPAFDFLIEKYGGIEAARTRMHIRQGVEVAVMMNIQKLDEKGLLVMGRYDEPPYVMTLCREEVYRAFLLAPKYIDPNIRSGIPSLGDIDEAIAVAVDLTKRSGRSD